MNFGPYDDQYYHVFADYRADENGRPTFIGPVEKDNWSISDATNYTENPSQIMKFEADFLEQRIADNHPGQIGDMHKHMSGFVVLP
ncbi:hypothetical protein [Parasulfitobacter algicola]|uniref:Uncharacterized protein n=1 Tax=Parasulfitobacter algicola TaxID=2614809 RepID=A0ABX2IYM6_9RHOB|nr:hypothetical protein [Sulfitobacter algicola]NSX55731.1 hypothetical protein [Sulfitobacter algicola]